MGISTTTNRIVYNGNGSSATFAFPYEFFAQADLEVFLFNSSTGVVSSQVLNTNYTIGGTPNLQGVYTAGGSVIFTSSIPSTHVVTINRNPSTVQNYGLNQNGTINSVALVQQMDYLTLLVQRLHDRSNRSLRLADGYPLTFSGLLPTSLNGSANQPLVVNSAGTGISFQALSANYITNTVIYAATPIQLASVPGASAGLVLQSNGSSAPFWGQVTLTGSSVAGTLSLGNGGTGGLAPQQWGVVFASSATQLATTDPAPVGMALISNASSAPTYQKLDLSLAAGSSLILPNGSVTAPAMRFNSAGNTGIYLTSPTELNIAMSSFQTVDMVFVNSASGVNYGFNTTAGVTGSNPLSFQANFNGAAYFQYYNASVGAASGTVFQIGNGAINLNNSTTIENWSNLAAGYLAGGSVIAATAFQSQLNIIAEATAAGAYIAFNVGGRSLATERMRLTSNVSLQLNGGLKFILQGSSVSGGQLTQSMANSSASYPIVWPANQGGANTFPQNDGSGNLVWASATSGSSAPVLAIATKTANYNMSVADDVVLVSSSNFTVNTYAPAGNSGRVFRVRKTDANIAAGITIAGSAALIDNSLSTTINTKDETITILCDGTNFFVLDRRINSTTGSSVAPTVQGFGTVSSNNQFSRRVGDSIVVQGSFLTGSVAAQSAFISIGFLTSGDLTVDTTKLSVNSVIGTFAVGVNSTATYNILSPPVNDNKVYLGVGAATNNPCAPALASAFAGNGQAIEYFFTVPIVGWKG